MNFDQYQKLFHSILENPAPTAPYDDADYLNYTKLNQSRMKRWVKTGKLSEAIIEKIKSITAPQKWIVITEPWCGDAAHIVPFLQMMADVNDKISIDYEQRDAEPYRILDYLTNGGKAIPKLIIKNNQSEEIANWGPRPAECQKLYEQLKAANAPMGDLKIALQDWYNKDEGQAIMMEIAALLQ